LRLRELTLETLAALTKKQGKPVNFIAAIHADHTDIRHIHVIALVDKRLTVKDFQLLRAEATKSCQAQRRLQDIETRRAKQWRRIIRTTLNRSKKEPERQASNEYKMISASPPVCANCGVGHVMKRIPGGFWCPSCRTKMRKEGPTTVIEKKEMKLERAYE
jgi:predicted Zn-ribbon and HTH transcriptional regulator